MISQAEAEFSFYPQMIFSLRQSERNKSAKMRRAGQAGRGTRARRIKEDTFSERNEALRVRRKQICRFISFGLP